MSTGNPMKSYRRYKGRGGGTAGGKLLRTLLVLLLTAVVAFGGLLGVVLAGSRDEIVGEPDAMLILGCQVMPSGAPSVLLRDRLDRALEYLEEHPDLKVVVSGGKGGDEILSEAEAMANYLIANGVSETRILLEDRATSTYENVLYSAELMKEYGLGKKGVVIVSNGFHLARAKMLWERANGMDEYLSVLAAPCSHIGSMLWMHVREPLVLAKDFLLRR